METLFRGAAHRAPFVARVAPRLGASSLRGRSAAVALVATLCFSCASGTDELRKEVAALHAEVTGVRADSAALSERLDALEIANGGLRGFKTGATAPGATGSDRPDLEVVHLGPGTTPGGDDVSPRTILRSTSGGIVQEDAKPDEQGPSPTADFTRAKDLLDKKSYGEALSAFSGFLVRFPDSPRAPDATYYRGVCYAAKNDPRHAIEQFEAVLATAPKSDKAADALEALAKAYDKLGDKPAAERAKKRLKAEYPKSPAATKKTD